MNCFSDPILVGARPSELSRSQVQEVLQELQQFYPKITFSMVWIDTKGDKDLHTSLRIQEKTNFFTEEIDDALLVGKCRIAIHSAKDLPDPLPPGLQVLAYTKGLDASDVIVLREGESLASLPIGAKIGTSSLRREESCKALRSDVSFVDIRGTIARRLSLLDQGIVDAVVIAKAALLRLGIHRTEEHLPGDPAPMQGKLAIVGREQDGEMMALFSCLHVASI